MRVSPVIERYAFLYFRGYPAPAPAMTEAAAPGTARESTGDMVQDWINSLEDE